VMTGRIASLDAPAGTLVLVHHKHHRTLYLTPSTTFTSAAGQSITRDKLKVGDDVSVHLIHEGNKTMASAVNVRPPKAKNARPS